MHIGGKMIGRLCLRVTKGVVQTVKAIIEGEIISSCGSQGWPGEKSRIWMGREEEEGT